MLNDENKLAWMRESELSISFLFLGGVNIPYAQLNIISIQFNFTTIACAGSLKETQSQDGHKFILGNPQGEENPTKLPLYRCIKSTKIKPQTGAPSPC